jgi:PEP-CTERM motif
MSKLKARNRPAASLWKQRVIDAGQEAVTPLETGGLFGSLTAAAPGSLSAVPEPSTWAMMLAGFGGLVLLAARRRRALSAIG